ncbi:MAG TPA: peptidoglycan recognition protein [Kofleriaceae bacterium]|nr:peptidoglycan recognition protein [Kofleriaceae bacterium]
MQKLAFALVLAVGCSSSSDPQDQDDHAAEKIVLEGQQLTDFFGAENVSPPIATPTGFRRIGLMWDATAEGALEVRTSIDGTRWTAWTTPQLTSHEEIAHAGHFDAIAGEHPLGSTAEDPRAIWYQLRVPAGSAAPTFIDIEPLEDIPAPADLVADVPADVSTPEMDAEELGVAERTTPIGSFTIHSRAEWHARAPRCSSGSQTPTRATIHHTVTPTNDSMSVPARLRQIQAFHMFTRGWCDIGYNFLVSRDGRIWRGRGARTIGAHVEGHNTGNVGVSFIGTYTSTPPNQAQMCNVAKLLRSLHSDYPVSLNRTDVKGHRQLGSTSCPGDALYAKIDTILAKARNGCQ